MKICINLQATIGGPILLNMGVLSKKQYKYRNVVKELNYLDLTAKNLSLFSRTGTRSTVTQLGFDRW